eukprot:TRINITY_DN5978_c0_g1_i8.p1 TRINITY_DN5978_c0_g1~~TRINITY_DN5978_c0_g1_i8.p1  ORF type:complete len:749 (+),score=83.36 TRINITY_DN5978_c0_g1_i8:327-2249(+)
MAFHCESDSDCPYSKCNVLSHQCSIVNVSTINSYADKFLTCLLNQTIPPFILSYLIPDPELRLYTGSDRLSKWVDAVRGNFSRNISVSVSKFNPSVWNAWTYYPLCDCACSPIALLERPTVFYPFISNKFNSVCNLPNTCRSDVSPFLFFSRAPSKFPQLCSVGLGEGECNSTTPVCALCEDPLTCVTFPEITTPQQCEGVDVCVDPSGVTHFNVSPDVCAQQYGQCYYIDYPNKYVVDPFCTTCNRDECELQSHCSIDYLFYPPWTTTPQNGICLVFLHLYLDVKDCSYIKGFETTGRTAWVTLQGYVCAVWNVTDEENCKTMSVLPAPSPVKRGYLWVPKGQNACELSPEFCYVDNLESLYTGPMGAWPTTKNQSDCDDCGGTERGPLRNLSRFWRAGTSRKATWHQPTLFPQADYTSTLDYANLGLSIYNSINTLFQFQGRTRATCEVLSPAISLSNLLCQCQNFSSELDESCSIYSSVTGGLVRVCYGYSNTMTVLPGIFEFSNTSISAPTECADVKGSYRSNLYYHTTIIPPLSSVFWLNPRTDDTLVCVNKNDAFVGVLISDGVLVNVEVNEGVSVNNVQVGYFSSLPSCTDAFLLSSGAIFKLMRERCILNRSNGIQHFNTKTPLVVYAEGAL